MSGVANKLMSAAGGEAGPEGAWDLSYAYYNPPEGLAWNLSTASYSTKSFSPTAQDSTPVSVFFKPDGLKMYVLGDGLDRVYEYNLSTNWNISTASFVQSVSVQSQDSSPKDLFFKPDGTKMYILGDSGEDVNEYDLSTAWDVSTASFLQLFSVAAQEVDPLSIFFKPDGTKMYILGDVGDDVNEYGLSTAWDISTASFLQLFSVAGQDLQGRGLFFKPDGTKMYILGASGDDVNEYSLSTAWDVSTASFLQLFSVASESVNPSNIFFRDNGGGFYVVDSQAANIYQYTLGGFSVAAQDTSPQDLFFKPDGLKMYVTGVSNDNVYEYDLTVGWDISTASFLQSFSVAAQEASPQSPFFKPDGTKMYILGSGGDDVNEYDLSTAWDVSTAVFLQLFSVASQETNPQGLYFRPDGAKMYVSGTGSDAVHEYNLSTSWDVSSASFVQSFSVATQEVAPESLFFKLNGTKMYVVGNTSDVIHEYTLSTAWNVSTASFTQSFSVQAQGDLPSGIFFRDDGAKMFTVDVRLDSVFCYTLGVQE